MAARREDAATGNRPESRKMSEFSPWEDYYT